MVVGQVLWCLAFFSEYLVGCQEQKAVFVPGTNGPNCARNNRACLCQEQITRLVPGTKQPFCSWYKLFQEKAGELKSLSNEVIIPVKIERKIQWEDNLEFGILVQFIILLPEGIEKIMFLGTAKITIITFHFY
ncbi:hypothetical protein V6B33_04965 [Mangrovibacillus sp. Mu-81]|uniref:hypothetical protein n=1 Tax=Mangrovibacillus sp. Mu-81 TaxID=3121478 RepID=UPI002FE4DBD0